MRKDQRLFDPNTQAISFEPTSVQCIQAIPEVFLDITTQMVPGVLPYYMISNYGRLWHEFLTVNIDSKGYLYKPLATDHGAQNVRIHRLVMLAFQYYKGCENMLVNHKDGNKGNCCIWNLEWTTYSENTNHAIRTGLLTNAKIDDATVHAICKELEDPDAKIIHIADHFGVNIQMVSAIANKRSHCDISDQYNIPRRKIANNLNIDQVKGLCEFYQTYSIEKYPTADAYYRAALVSIGLEENSIGSLTVRSAQKVYTKQTYQYISKYYRF